MLEDNACGNVENIKLIEEYFKRLTQIEQTVFMIDNLNVLSTSLIKFLVSVCLDFMENKTLSSNDTRIETETSHYSSILEEQANDLGYFRLLKQKPIETKLKMINMYLPLIKKSSSDLKNAYYEFLEELFHESLESGKHFIECTQASLLASVHPMFNENERQILRKWSLKFNGQSHAIIENNKEKSDNFSEPILNMHNENLNRSFDSMDYSSLAPSIHMETSNTSNFTQSNLVEIDSFKIESNKANQTRKDEVKNFVKQPLKGYSSLPINQTTHESQNSWALIDSNNIFNSEEDLNETKNKGSEYESNIINLNQWLRYLRLHKYTSLFSQMTYDEIIGLNDEQLIKFNVTLGARKRILSNIDKLKSRNQKLQEFIKVLEEKNSNVNIEEMLFELSEMSITPMKPVNSPPTSLALIEDSTSFSQINSLENSNDLSFLFVQVLEKIQLYILGNEQNSIDEHATDNSKSSQYLFNSYAKLIDKLFLTKAFSDFQNAKMSKLRSIFQEKLNESAKSRSSTGTLKTHSNGFYRNTVQKINGNSAYSNQSTLNYLNARQRIMQKNQQQLQDNLLTRSITRYFSAVE